MGKKAWVLLAILLAFFAMVFFHELTHVALNNWRVEGFCIGMCEMSVPGLLGNYYTPVSVYLTRPVLPLAENETIAGAVGLAAFAFVILFSVFLIRKRW